MHIHVYFKYVYFYMHIHSYVNNSIYVGMSITGIIIKYQWCYF